MTVLAYCGKWLTVGVGGAAAVIAVVVLDQASKDRKARKAALLHDGTYPAWGATL